VVRSISRLIEIKRDLVATDPGYVLERGILAGASACAARWERAILA
jgi:hypothetical protein